QLQIHLEQTYAQKLQQLQIHLEQTYAQKVTQLEQSQKGRREVSPEYLLSKLGELEAKFNLLNSKTSPLEQHLRTLSETSKTSGAEQKTLREMIQNTKLNLDTLTAKVTDFDKSSMPELMKKIKELETRIQALKTNHPPQETITEEASTPSSTDEVKKKL
ncbi:MAG: hypothetical protein KBD31_00930, partial [Proteobacteria bacterium]|nr:hypothetical protein [Pseudomonadota bacterium]